MKTFLQYFCSSALALFILAHSHAQVKSISSALSFERDRVSSKISATSQSLSFTTRVIGKTSALSPVLNFGAPPVLAKTQTQIVQQPVLVEEKKEDKKKESATANSQIAPKNSQPSDRKVEEKEVKPPVTETVSKTSVEGLGTEYKNNIPDYYAIIIGISDYKFAGQGIDALQNPVKDAEKLHNILTTQYQFKKEKVKLLKNATRQQIIDAFESLSGELGPKDNLLIFYAGHGYYDKSKDFGYWLPSDARVSSRSDWIPNSTVKDYISAIKSKHTLLITDACFAGSIFKTRAVDDYKTLKIYELYKNASRKALTSGNLSEVPDKSVFMDQIIKNLTENEDEHLPAQRLFIRIYEPVTNNSSGDPKFGVIQGAGDEGGDFIFIKKM